ncbi:MAG: helix-hairpin-helix domain-containing protein [Lachnospiraceae bacterium]|nr:helix-hairpin-helix domain-containing protein [Lachnospiraceae bacterium]
MVTEAVLPVLPSEKTVSESGTDLYTVSQQSADGRIDINTADRDALMTLKGIGEKKALAVIAYREEHGGFESTEELMKVKGIGEKTFAGLKDKVTVGR